MINEPHRAPPLCILCPPACIVGFQPLLQIVCIAGVQAPVPTLQYIDNMFILFHSTLETPLYTVRPRYIQ